MSDKIFSRISRYAIIYKILVPVTVLIVWFTGISRWTNGFAGFTTYSVALQKAGPVPRAMPDLPMTDQNGNSFHFSNLNGKYILVDFMYLHCSTVCGIIRSRLFNYLPELKNALDTNLVLLSVSFDPQRDTPDILRGTWGSLGSSKNWHFASVNGSYEEITNYLAKIGFIRSQAKNGDFNHTAMLYVIDPQGKLAGIIDPSRGERKNLEEILRIVSEKKI